MSVPVFPTLVTKLPARSIIGSFELQETISGLRTNLPFFSYPRYGYTVDIDVLRSYGTFTEWQQLEAFFKTMVTAPGVFAYNDPDDGAVSAQQFGIGDGVTTSWQLIRALGGFAEPVFCVTGTPEVFFNTVGPQPSGNYSIDSYGQITFGSAPSSGVVLTWTGTYNWYCRFDKDTINLVKTGAGFRQLKALTFSTEKF